MEENQQEQQEILFKLSVLEQHINQLQQQLEAVDQGIFELDSLNLDLNDLIGAEGREVLTSVGKGIFTKYNRIAISIKGNYGSSNI